MIVSFDSYYGGYSVCLPKIFITQASPSWPLSILVSTINFSSFLAVAVGYILIHKRTKKSSQKVNQNARSQNKEKSRKSKLLFENPY